MNFWNYLQKEENKILKYELIGLLAGIIGMFLFHFAFEWLGSFKPLAWLFATNESVWEHTKILLMPYLIYTIVEFFLLKPQDAKNFFAIKSLSMLLIPLVMIVVHYVYTGIIGSDVLFIDILLSFIIVFGSYYLSYYLLSKGYKIKNADYLIMGAGFLVFLTVLFTYVPPHIDLFLDTTTGKYGLK